MPIDSLMSHNSILFHDDSLNAIFHDFFRHDLYAKRIKAFYTSLSTAPCNEKQNYHPITKRVYFVAHCVDSG